MGAGALVLLALAVTLLGGCGGGGAHATGRHDITAAQLQAMMDDGAPLTIIDLSAADYYATQHIPGSVNLTAEGVDTWSAGMSKALRICTVCT